MLLAGLSYHLMREDGILFFATRKRKQSKARNIDRRKQKKSLQQSCSLRWLHRHYHHQLQDHSLPVAQTKIKPNILCECSIYCWLFQESGIFHVPCACADDRKMENTNKKISAMKNNLKMYGERKSKHMHNYFTERKNTESQCVRLGVYTIHKVFYF